MGSIEHMFGQHGQRARELVVNQLRSMLRRLDVSLLSGAQAVTLLDWFAEVERLAAAGKALVAGRAAETNQWRHGGDRSPEEWLANRTGVGFGAAKEALTTARRLQDLPATNEAVRAGRLSPGQAAVVADAASVDPDAERSLLDAAPDESLKELRNRAERVKAAARSAEDQQEREARVHAGRFLRKSVTADGAHELHARGTAASISMFMGRLQPFVDAEFTQARDDGRREAPEAYAYDALMAMSQSGGAARSPAKVIVSVDLAALRRGTPEDGEVCEIAGFGPISVAEAMRQMNEAFLTLVCTKGKDVYNVAHLGRQFTELQKTAMEWQNPECAVRGCSNTVRLERDHRDDWAHTHETKVASSDRLCHHHHRLKTLGWRLEEGTGKRRLLPPQTDLVLAGHDPP
ncbi:MAG: protein of unknown function endonuclease [Actinomycetia bacterium]|nr:protein of unknown function endonuclease [Actinomycetes bacterium]